MRDLDAEFGIAPQGVRDLDAEFGLTPPQPKPGVRNLDEEFGLTFLDNQLAEGALDKPEPDWRDKVMDTLSGPKPSTGWTSTDVITPVAKGMERVSQELPGPARDVFEGTLGAAQGIYGSMPYAPEVAPTPTFIGSAARGIGALATGGIPGVMLDKAAQIYGEQGGEAFDKASTYGSIAGAGLTMALPLGVAARTTQKFLAPGAKRGMAELSKLFGKNLAVDTFSNSAQAAIDTGQQGGSVEQMGQAALSAASNPIYGGLSLIGTAAGVPRGIRGAQADLGRLWNEPSASPARIASREAEVAGLVRADEEAALPPEGFSVRDVERPAEFPNALAMRQQQLETQLNDAIASNEWQAAYELKRELESVAQGDIHPRAPEDYQPDIMDAEPDLRYPEPQTRFTADEQGGVWEPGGFPVAKKNPFEVARTEPVANYPVAKVGKPTIEQMVARPEPPPEIVPEAPVKPLAPEPGQPPPVPEIVPQRPPVEAQQPVVAPEPTILPAKKAKAPKAGTPETISDAKQAGKMPTFKQFVANKGVSFNKIPKAQYESLVAEYRGIEEQYKGQLTPAAKRIVSDIEAAEIMQRRASKAKQGKANPFGGKQKGSATFDPESFSDAAKLAVYHVESGIRDFASWSKQMLTDFGEAVRPHLEYLWNQAHKQLGIAPATAKAQANPKLSEVKRVKMEELPPEAQALMRELQGSADVKKEQSRSFADQQAEVNKARLAGEKGAPPPKNPFGGKKAPPPQPEPQGRKYAGAINLKRFTKDPEVEAEIVSKYLSEQKQTDEVRGIGKHMPEVVRGAKLSKVHDWTDAQIKASRNRILPAEDVLALGNRHMAYAELAKEGKLSPEQVETYQELRLADQKQASVVGQTMVFRKIHREAMMRAMTQSGKVMERVSDLYPGEKIPDDVLAKIRAAGEDATKLYNIYKKEARKKQGKLSWVHPMFYINMLSGVGTQFTNIYSTASNVTLQPVIKAIAGAIESPKALFGKEQNIYAGESLRYLYAASKAIPEASARFLYYAKNGFSEYTAKAAKEIKVHELPGGLAVNWPLRGLGAFDEFNSGIAEVGETAAIAYRMANNEVRKLKLKGEAKARKIVELAGILADNPTPEMLRQIKTHRKTALYRSDLPAPMQFLEKVVNSTVKIKGWDSGFAPLKMFQPFIKISYNAPAELLAYTPASLLRLPFTSKARSEVMAKVALGTAGLGVALSLSDRITGPLPEQAGGREKHYEAKKKSWTLNIGGYPIPLVYFGPFAAPFVIAGALREAKLRHKKDPDVNTVRAAIGMMVKYMVLDSSFAAGLDGVLKALEDLDSKGAALGANLISQAIPYSGLLRWVNNQKVIPKLGDEFQRDATTFWEKVVNNIPFASEAFLKPKINTLGQPVKRAGYFPKQDRGDPVYAALDKLGIGVGPVSRKQSIQRLKDGPTKEVILSKGQRYEMQKAVGDKVYDKLLTRVQSPLWNTYSPARQKSIVDDIMGTYRGKVNTSYKSKLGKPVQDDTGIWRIKE